MNKRYDFFIYNFNIIIEVHGQQHYKNTIRNGWKSFEEESKNDNFKCQLANDNKINDYIVIDARYSNLEYIKENILNSNISSYYDLSNINWIECHKYACNSLVKDVCNLWNKGIKNKRVIGEKISVTKDTVAKYLKQGTLLGWCDYIPKKIKKEKLKLYNKKNKKPRLRTIINLETSKIFLSITDACKFYNFKSGSRISDVCNNKAKTAYGYHWMYYENYLESSYEEINNKIKILKNIYYGKSVINLDTKEIFISVNEAGRKYKIHSSNISRVCKKERKTAKEYRWMYYNDYLKEIKGEIII
jgi:hypothetical protein